MIEMPITVMGMDTLGEPFKEAATTTSISCYGCKYRSRRYAPKDSVVTLEIRPPSMPKASRIAHARVIWVQRPRHHRETFQIGLELETPGNVWGIDSPPPDWFPAPAEGPALQATESVSAAPAENALVLEVATKSAPAAEWETLQLPQQEPTAVAAATLALDKGIEDSSLRGLVGEAVKMTADAIVAEEIALVRKHFTGRLESALIETLKTFSEMTTEIVAETRAACRESTREMEAEFQRLAREATPVGEASAHKPISPRRRRKALRIES
jgi:hypothetical protein